MRAFVLAALLSLAGASPLRAQEPAAPPAGPDTIALPAAPDTARAPGIPDTLPAPDAQPDTARAAGVPDTLPGPGARPDTAAAVADTARQKILDRTPLFPQDIDPYTPVGLGSPALVVGREELAAWPGATLADVLPRLWPLATDDQGGPGFFQDVRLPSDLARGTRWLIDGRPVETPLGPAADLRTLPVMAIERLEIHAGPAPVTGGAEAGWINVVTRTHLTPQANSALRFEIGSFGREGFGAALGRWLGSRLSVFATLQFEDAETFTQVASAEDSRFWGKARLYLSSSQFVEAAYGTSGVTTNTNRSVPAAPSPFTGTEDRRERRFQALYRGRVGPATLAARYYADRFEERSAFALGEAPLVGGDFERRGARASVRLELAGGVAQAGAEWTEEDLDSGADAFLIAAGTPLADSAGLGFAVPLARVALFAGFERVADSLQVAAHARLERFDKEEGGGSGEPSVSVEARYGTRAGFAPFARAGVGARFPSFSEAAALARVGGRDALRVASSRELRAGASWRAPGEGGPSAELSGFVRRGSDASFWLPPTGWRAADGAEEVRIGAAGTADFGPGEYGDVNLLDVDGVGVEGRGELPLPFDVRAEGWAQLRSVEDVDGEPLPYVASQQALGRLVFEDRFFPSGNLRVRAALGTRVVGARPTRSGEDLPAYALMDGLLRVQLIGFTLGLSGQNILDLRYRTEEGFTLPGRVIGFEVLWEFWD